MKKFLRFLGSKVFFKNLGIMVVLTILLVWIALKLVDTYTLHGKSITVPDFTGVKMQELSEFVDDKALEFVIVDSIYSTVHAKGSVINQDPKPNTKVKNGRTIYLTVIAMMPEKVTMPDLKDLTLRQAIARLETYGLKVGKLKYVPDMARNNVLKQKHNGEIIKPGTSIEKGKKIDLVLGKGLSFKTTHVPDLYGKTRNEAIRLINAASLNIGLETFENDVDKLEAIVYKQSPKADIDVRLGAEIDLWYRSIDYFDEMNE